MNQTYDDYLKALEGIKEKIPVHVYEFVSNPERHDLNSPHSLHDSWLTSLVISENRIKTRPFEPQPGIEIVLLGQKHDRDIVLEYSGITWYKLSGTLNPFNSGETFHGDVEAHVVRVENESIIHEIEFVSKSKIVVACKDFTCTERIHA